MGSSPQPNFGNLQPWSTQGEYNTIAFAIQQAILKTQTSLIVKVLNCTNNDAVSVVGTVDVQILVNQLDGDGNAVPHGTLHSLPYLRLAGGSNGIILDPKPGDIGLVSFCSRDISSVIATLGQANPGSRRHHDFADGVFVGVCLQTAAPVQYIQFSDDGITLVSPTKVTIQAPSIQLSEGAAGSPLMNREIYDWLVADVLPALTAHGIAVPAIPASAIALTSTVEAD